MGVFQHVLVMPVVLHVMSAKCGLFGTLVNAPL